MAKARRTVDVTADDARLRRESPAYSGDTGWEAVEPQAASVVMSVRLDPGASRQLAELARSEGGTPSGIIRRWVLERLRQERVAPAHRAIGEAVGTYQLEPDGFEDLRERYRPQDIRVLMVGESRPAGGSFFYLANSRLFFATREAFVRARGSAPNGDEFLRVLQQEGVWLFDMSSAPVNRQPGRPRREAVERRSAELDRLLREVQPRTIVAIKRSLEPIVRAAVASAGLSPDRLIALPFPLYQWREEYVAGLAEVLR